MKTLQLLKKFKVAFSKAEEKFGRAELVDGTTVEWIGDLVEGSELFVVGEDDELSPAPNGQHELENGAVVSVEDGVVTSIDGVMEAESDEDEMEDDVEMESDDVEMESDEVEMADDDEVEMDREDVMNAINTAMDLLGGTEGPLNEDSKDEVFGLLQSVMDMLQMYPDPDMSESEDEVEMEDNRFDEVLSSVDNISKLLNSITERLDATEEKLAKVSKEPSVDEKKKKINNSFNKTKTKTKGAERAKAILSAK